MCHLSLESTHGRHTMSLQSVIGFINQTVMLIASHAGVVLGGAGKGECPLFPGARYRPRTSGRMTMADGRIPMMYRRGEESPRQWPEGASRRHSNRV